MELFPAGVDSIFHEYLALLVSFDQVKENFARFNLLDGQVVFVQGLFKSTLDILPAIQIAVLLLDGDMYESTIGSLRQLYDETPSSSWFIVDDYEVVPACRQAVYDFFNERRINAQLNVID